MIGKTIQRPSDLEISDANLHSGAVNGGTSQLFQQLIFRPVPGFGRPGTPVENVFLGSAGATRVVASTEYADATRRVPRSPRTGRPAGSGAG